MVLFSCFLACRKSFFPAALGAQVYYHTSRSLASPFCLFFAFLTFCTISLQKSPPLLTAPLCIFFSIYNVLYSADRYSFCRILHHGEGLNCQADFVLKKAPVFCQKRQNTKSCGHSLDLSLNSDIMKSLFRILRRAVAHTKVCSRLYQNRTDTADQMEEFL